jgi:hypothetical protein
MAVALGQGRHRLAQHPLLIALREVHHASLVRIQRTCPRSELWFCGRLSLRRPAPPHPEVCERCPGGRATGQLVDLAGDVIAVWEPRVEWVPRQRYGWI